MSCLTFSKPSSVNPSPRRYYRDKTPIEIRVVIIIRNNIPPTISNNCFRRTSVESSTDFSWIQVSVLGEVSLCRNNPTVL